MSIDAHLNPRPVSIPIMWSLSGSLSDSTSRIEIVHCLSSHSLGPKVEHFLDSLNQNCCPGAENVVGFDLEWSFKGSEAKVSQLVFCHGSGYCLVVHLDSFSECLNPLLRLLRQPNLSFVGMGIKDNVAALEKEYGIRCRNATDLGSLAAELKKDPLLKSCGMHLLMSRIGLTSLPEPSIFERRVILSLEYSNEQVKAAARNCYAYCRIGRALFKYRMRNFD